MTNCIRIRIRAAPTVLCPTILNLLSHGVL